MDAVSTIVNRPGEAFVLDMASDPRSIFGGLLAGCISDEYDRPGKVLAEGALLMVLGAFCSVATTYLLSLAGFLV